jgi:hypothetical protein
MSWKTVKTRHLQGSEVAILPAEYAGVVADVEDNVSQILKKCRTGPVSSKSAKSIPSTL